MDPRTLLAEKLFVPMYEERWGLRDPELERSLSRSQYLSEDEIREQQWKKLRALVDHAGRSNPFYRRRWADLGFEPGDLKSWADFEALPLLTKDDVRDHLDDLICSDSRREDLFHKRTGGSTGLPVHLYWDPPAHRFKRQIVRRHDRWAGYRLGMKLAALWGDTEKSYPWKERLFKALCERTIFLDTLRMDEAYLDAFVDRMRRFRPLVLIGHAHSLFFFTEHLVERGVGDLGVRSIISTAESLSPEERARIEDHFGEIVFDRYGCEELSLIASECEAHDGLHTSAEGLYVEVLGGDTTTPGRVVVTDLVNRGMPFLRYEVGDLATVAPGPCTCGRGLPRLRRVHGRTSDILYAPDGRRISGISILDTFLIHIPGVRQAQIVQDALDHVTLRVVRDSTWSEDSAAGLHRAVEEVFGPEMRHDLEPVESIAPTARGKYQFSICEISPPSPSGEATESRP